MLEPFLKLSISYKLIILENLQTERSIVNSTQCRLYDIVQPKSTRLDQDQLDQLLCLLVSVPKDNYSSPFVNKYTQRDKAYAIIPIYIPRLDDKVTLIRREIYIINELSTKVLISINIITCIIPNNL